MSQAILSLFLPFFPFLTIFLFAQYVHASTSRIFYILCFLFLDIHEKFERCAAIASEFSDLREFLPAGPLKRYPVGTGIDP